MIKSIKNLTPRLAEIGKIKIGGKSEKIKKTRGGKDFQFPVKYDHFVITELTRDQHNNLKKNEEIMKAIGANARKLDIVFLYDEIELNFMTSYAFYTGRSCVCRGDGKEAERTTKDGNKKVECKGYDCEFMHTEKNKPQCKPNGVLSVYLPCSNKIGGVFKLRTTSWNSVQNILSAMTFFKTYLTGGHLAGIPFQLEMVKKYNEAHGNLETINLTYAGNENALQIAASNETKRRETLKLDIKKFEQLAIETGVTEDNDDPADIEDEFYNEGAIVNNESKALEISADVFAKPKIKKAVKKAPKEKKKTIAKSSDSVAEVL